MTRGPQGALYGVNAVGGVLNAISTRPQDTFGFSATAGYGFELQRYEGQAIVNVPLTDTLAIRAGYQHAERHDGFFINTVTGKAGDIENYDGGRFAIRWAPSSHFQIFSTLDISNELSPSNRVRVVYKVNDPTGLTPAQIPPPDVDGPYLYTANSSNAVTRDLVSGMVRVEADSPFGRLTSITAYRTRTTDFRQDEDGSALGAVQLPFPGPSCSTRSCTTEFTDQTQLFSQELRVQGRFADRATYLFGGNLNQRNSAFAMITDGRTVSATNPALSPTSNQSSVSIDEEFQYGLYGSIGYTPVDRLTLTAAGRYNHSEKSIDAYLIPRMAGSTLCPYTDPINGLAQRAPPCVAQRAVLGADFNNFAPSVSAQYKINPGWQVYATTAIGYRAGGFNGNSVLDSTIPASFSPEKNIAYEVGTKFKVLNARVSVAAFYNAFSNFLITGTSIGADNTSRNFRVNAGEAETHGLDLEIEGRAGLGSLGKFLYSAAVNWLDGKIKSGRFQGRTVEGSPEWTVTLTGIYKIRIAPGVDFLASSTYRGQRGGFFTTTLIDNKINNPDLDLVDARLAIETKRWRFEAITQNLFNRTYEILRDPQRSTYGDPRTVAIKVGYRFGSEGKR